MVGGNFLSLNHRETEKAYFQQRVKIPSVCPVSLR
jgi:hypothetical protein